MHENVINNFIELILPYIISVLELMGIAIVTWSSLKAFWRYIANTVFHKKYDMQYRFATGLAAALEFKMAAEILKTVLVREMSELLVLGAIIILRALITLFLRLEIREKKKEEKASEKESKTEKVIDYTVTKDE